VKAAVPDRASRPARLQAHAAETRLSVQSSQAALTGPRQLGLPRRLSAGAVAGKWGVPGGKRARKKAKDSVDGGPLKVAAGDEVGRVLHCMWELMW
jgi:hypothetical protein